MFWKKTEIDGNWQLLFSSDDFIIGGYFRKKVPAKVEVYRDWDNNRLLKLVNGRVMSKMRIPRNWTDAERKDGRKWVVKSISPMGGNKRPWVGVVLHDKMTGSHKAEIL